jgi:hypothetical protein
MASHQEAPNMSSRLNVVYTPTPSPLADATVDRTVMTIDFDATDYPSVNDLSCIAIYQSAMVMKAAMKIDPDLGSVLDWFENDIIAEFGETPLSMVLQGRYVQVILFLDRCSRVESSIHLTPEIYRLD